MNKLSFKPLELEDAKLIFENREAKVSYFSAGLSKKDFNSRTFKDFQNEFKKQIEDIKLGSLRAFIILNKEEEYIGRCSINTINNQNSSAGISLSIKEKFWGKGYGSETVNFLEKLAFSKLKLHRLEYKASSHNERSQKLAKKLGFKLDGTLRDAKKIGNKYYDMLVYSKLKNEYKK